MDSKDWEQVDLFIQKRFPLPAFTNIKHGHLSVLDIRPHVPQKILDSYYKFTFIRNPYDRFVSSCFFLFAAREAFAQNPVGFMKKLLKQDKELPLMFRPQLSYIENPIDSNNSFMDFHGDFEYLQRDFDKVCTELKLPLQQLEILNTTKHDNWETYYDEELKQLVQDRYRADLKLYQSIQNR